MFAEMREGTAVQDWLSRFQEAALDPAQWIPALQMLADKTGSSRAELVGFGGRGFIPFNWLTSADERMARDFERVNGGSPHLNFRLAADDGSSILSVVDERTYDVTRRRMIRGDYIDFCEEHQLVFGCQTVLHREPNGLIGMSLLRSRTDGRSDENMQRILLDAGRAARVALRMQRAIEQQGAQLLAGALGAMTLPCMLVDGLGRVQLMTAAAEDALRNELLLTVKTSVLSSTDGKTDARIREALASVLGPLSAPQVSLAIAPRDGGPIKLDFFRLPRREWALPFAPRAIIVLRRGGGDLREQAAICAATYGLTPAETDVAIALSQGRTRQRIAADRNVSMETLRTQIRNLYSKTGCSREAELVVLLRTFFS